MKKKTQKRRSLRGVVKRRCVFLLPSGKMCGKPAPFERTVLSEHFSRIYNVHVCKNHIAA